MAGQLLEFQQRCMRHELRQLCMQGTHQILKRSAALQLLSAHMRQNVVRLGKKWCRQVQGIPQVHPLFCSHCYIPTMLGTCRNQLAAENVDNKVPTESICMVRNRKTYNQFANEPGAVPLAALEVCFIVQSSETGDDRVHRATLVLFKENEGQRARGLSGPCNLRLLMSAIPKRVLQ